MSLGFFQHGAARTHHSKTFGWLVHLGAPGLFGVSFVDATIVPLAIPGSTDLLLLWLVAHGRNPYLLVACAVIGSILGGYTTWRLGKKGGEAAIKRYVPPRLQPRIHNWAQNHSILALLVPAVLPPPVPLWPFLLAAGGLGATRRRFLAAFGGGRTIRYGLEGWLAVAYGRHIVKLWSAALDKWGVPVIWTMVALTVLGLIYSLWKLRLAGRKAGAEPPVAEQRAA